MSAARAAFWDPAGMSIQEDWLSQGGLPLSWWSVPQPVWALVSRSQIRTRSVADGATVRHEGSLVGTFWRLTSLAPMRAGGSLARALSRASSRSQCVTAGTLLTAPTSCTNAKTVLHPLLSQTGFLCPGRSRCVQFSNERCIFRAGPHDGPRAELRAVPAAAHPPEGPGQSSGPASPVQAQRGPPHTRPARRWRRWRGGRRRRRRRGRRRRGRRARPPPSASALPPWPTCSACPPCCRRAPPRRLPRSGAHHPTPLFAFLWVDSRVKRTLKRTFTRI